MTSRLAFLPLAFAVAGLSGAIAHVENIESRDSPPPPTVDTRDVVEVAQTTQQQLQPAPPPRPAGVQVLEAQILERVRSFNGMSGIAIKSIDDGWEAGWRTERLLPQQSVSKMWVALTALDKADKGEVDLNTRVTLGRNDLTLWSRATANRVLRNGWTASLDELLYEAITKSDNHANDKLMWAVGGPQAVRDTLAAKGLDDINFYEGERALQAKIAGLTWNASYSLGNNFSAARARVPASQRSAAFNAYIDNPYDGASAIGIARALAKLERGELLSPQSTAKLLTTMGMTKTGRLRVQGGIKAGWSWSHKTGTGQNYRGRVGGLNDIGILTAPDGSSYAVAMLTVPNATDGGAQELMRDVTRMIIAYHEQHGSQGFSL
ncbi:serine hydrolase [Sphingomicrobium clamense]|uniref:beta-lactamase n=1 Tax=Sphingomicrobium clamense TaxID=2851013 RepID=A0ABS6V3R0_9SPHN|nr:serine hydrolase [Sphingomicrobium sp. B8]MBW0143990.1 class A beta-lactamase-related serine hydrolase [Sphingomicrobium sp. B8]